MGSLFIPVDPGGGNSPIGINPGSGSGGGGVPCDPNDISCGGGGSSGGGDFPPLPSGPGGGSPGGSGIGSPGGGGPSTGGPETDLINVVNNFSVANNIDTSPIGAAINSGIQNVVGAVTQATNNVTSAVTQQVSSLSNSLFGWAKNVLDWLGRNIGSLITSIGSVLKNVATQLLSAIKDAVSSAIDTLTKTIGPIIGTIEKDISKVVDFYSQHIQPILQGVSDAIRIIQAAINAIEADVKSGVKGLLQLPTDLYNALQGLDQVLIRAGKALRVKVLSDADIQWVGKDGRSITDHVGGISEAVTGLLGQVVKTTWTPGKESLSEPTLRDELPKILEAINAIVDDVIKGLKNLSKNPWDLLEAGGIAAGGILAGAFEPFEFLFAVWEILKTPLEIVGELAAETARTVMPLEKLDANTLTQAWRRNLIDQQTMDNEMLVQGYNSQRSDLLRRLTTYVESDQNLVEMLYRGIITADDYSAGLQLLGYTQDQITALTERSTRLLDAQTALEAWQRSEIDDTILHDTLKAQRYDEDQITLMKALALGPASYSDAYRAYNVGHWLDEFLIAKPVYETIPQEVRNAGANNGMSPDAVLAQWTGTVNTLPVEHWLNLYWRGQASANELKIALRRDRVPDELMQNWIDAQRPLIEYRTIPSLVSAGLLTDAEALQMLQAHGYSLSDSTLLLQYATRAKGAKKATVASAAHATSMQTAKAAYEDGLLTSDQYLAILKEHGLDDNAAALELQLTDVEAHTKQRKQIGTDIVAEYQAGLIDQQTALQQLADSGLTVAEQATYAKRLKSASTGKAKLPSEADLRAFATKGIITVDDYEKSLVTIGYSPAYASDFRQLHFPAG